MYPIDFTKENRLDITAVIISFARFAFQFLRQGMLVLAIIFARNPHLLRSGTLWLILSGLIAIIVVYSYVYYRFYKFHVDIGNREFVLNRGALSKSKTVVKFNNIIQVNLNQNLLQKLLSIYSLTINTAGSDKVEVDLYALDETTAQALRSFLMEAIGGNDTAVLGLETRSQLSDQLETAILKIPAKNILLISLLSNYRQGLVLFFAFVISLYQQLQDVFELLGRTVDYELDVMKWQAWLSMLIFLAVFVLFIPFLINLFRYFFKYYDFTIVRNPEGNFSMRYGLFNTKDVIFNKNRVQTVSFRQNGLLKYFNLGYISLKQVIVDVAKYADSVIEMPGVTTRDKKTVYDLVFEEDIYADVTEMRPSIGLFVNRAIMANIVFLPLVLIVSIILDSYTTFFWIGAVFAECCILLLTFVYYKNYRFYVGEEYLIKRTMIWNEVETVVPIRNTQIVEVSQTFWQERSSTANLQIKTAAGSVGFYFFDEQLIKDISNRVLYQLER